jgi:hypothetical protein
LCGLRDNACTREYRSARPNAVGAFYVAGVPVLFQCIGDFHPCGPDQRFIAFSGRCGARMRVAYRTVLMLLDGLSVRLADTVC